MKKLLALVLSMMMAVSLAAPAFADGSDGPAPDDGWEEAVPISAILDESLGVIGGADGPTDIVVEFPAADEYLAAHPGLEEQLRANAYDYFDQEYGGYWTAEEYMETWEMTEEEFLDEMVQEQLYPLIREVFYQRQRDAVKEALGGVPGQIGVMFNGAYIQFPDAAPEVKDSTTMVPVRALMEALGGQVSYQDGEDKTGFVSMPQVVCTANGVTVTFEANGANVEITRQSAYDSGEMETDSVTMPVCTYQKNGRTYVPLRFTAQCFGCEVGWDNDFQTAVLLDRGALAAQFDEKFTILNRALANRAFNVEEGENYRADLKGGITFTAFDTLHGNKTYQWDFTGKTLLNTEAASGTYSVTMSDSAADALMERLIGAGWAEYADDEDVALLRTVLTGLKDMELILNRDGFGWFHAPVLDELSGEDDVWCGFDMGAELGKALFAGTDAATVGTLLAAGMSANSVMDYSTVGAMAQMMFDIYGDDKFTTSGGTSTLTLNLDDLEELGSYGTLGVSYDYYDYREYQFTLKVDSKGAVTLSCTAETEARYGVPAVRMTLDGTLSDGKASMSVSYHVMNAGELKLSLSAARQTTGGKPLAEPPEGANVVEAGELLNP